MAPWVFQIRGAFYFSLSLWKKARGRDLVRPKKKIITSSLLASFAPHPIPLPKEREKRLY